MKEETLPEPVDLQRFRPLLGGLRYCQDAAVEIGKDTILAEFDATLREAVKRARRLPSDYVNDAGILASDSPAVVVQKLDAAARSKGEGGT